MEQTEQPAIVIRDARDTDIAEMIDIYYAVESKSRHEPMESWSREEMIEQFHGWIREKRHAICLVALKEDRVKAFTVCLIRSKKLATLEIFVAALEDRKDWRRSGATQHSGECLFRAICDRARALEIETLNTMVNREYHDFRRHTRFLSFRGFRKTGEFVEYEFELFDDED